MTKLNDFFKPRSIIGWVIITIALLILFENLGMGVFSKVAGNWPLALIIIGVAMIYGSGKDSSRTTPYMLIGLGILFFLAKYDAFNIRWGSFILPLLLLIAGVYFIKPRLFRSHGGVDDPDYVDVFSFLGGGEFSPSSTTIKGGNITCILGGADIDLKNSDIENDSVTIEVFALMGGAEIEVPPHWQVSVKAVPFLGGVTNKSTCLAEKLQMPKKTLVITGWAILGGIDVKN